MNVVIFGATGMIGRGALLECLDDARVQSVLVVGRRPCGMSHSKLRELIHRDLFDLETERGTLRGYDVCLFCLGVSSTGMSESAYRRITYELTISVVTLLTELNPDLTLCFVSGQGTDATGESRFMWARVKGETENALLAMPIRVYMFRPGFIQPLRGVRSRTKSYQAIYTLLTPAIPLLRRLFPRHVTTTVDVGRAMLRVAGEGYDRRVLETVDINGLAAATSP